MSPRLDEIFGELGITQYLDAFVDQGFDTWETILDITESDLDALGVKLGHRRKLQRRIANARGIGPNAILASPIKSIVEDASSESSKPDVSPTVSTNGAREAGLALIQKRKYRRHPKRDENAPIRPQSAYVLFSNKMREDLQGQNLTFTEIAKLVGENWQSLTQAEKEPFERQAQEAKEKYNHDLAEYKQTAGYKKYLQYLQDFKVKHANSEEKDNNKRVRLSDPSATETNGGVLNHTGSIRRVGSIGETNGGTSGARQRIGSIVSTSESCYAPSMLSGSMRTPTEESSAFSPNGGYFDRQEHSPSFSPKDSSAPPTMAPIRRDPSYVDGHRNDSLAPSRHLPSLSDMFDGRQMPNGSSYSSDQQIGPNPVMLPRGYQTASPAHTPSTCGSESRPPSLKKELSSGGSLSSGSSYSSYPRTPIESTLPIHALLTNAKQLGPHDMAYATNPAIYRSTSPDDRGLPAQYPQEAALGDSNAARQPMPLSNSHSLTPNHTSNAPPPRYQFGYHESRQSPAQLPPPTPSNGAPKPIPAMRPNGKADAGLDGISALLQADKFVERR